MPSSGDRSYIFIPPVRAHRLISACRCMYLIFRPEAVIAIGDGVSRARMVSPRPAAPCVSVSCVCNQILSCRIPTRLDHGGVLFT